MSEAEIRRRQLAERRALSRESALVARRPLSALPSPRVQVSEPGGVLMSGVVVVAGVFPPGSEVELFRTDGEHVLRPEGSGSCGRRLVDVNGNVGYDGLEVGSSYILRGYVAGNYTLVRARAVDAAAPDSELAQPPIQAATPVIGTQEAVTPDVPPAPPSDADELPVGVPDGVSTGVFEPEPKLYVLLVPGAVFEAADWSLADAWVPVHTASDGSTIGPEPLYRFVGVGDPVLGADWQEYAGPTEPVPVASDPVPPAAEAPTPQTTPVASEAPLAETSPVVAETPALQATPVVADAPPLQTPVPAVEQVVSAPPVPNAAPSSTTLGDGSPTQSTDAPASDAQTATAATAPDTAAAPAAAAPVPSASPAPGADTQVAPPQA